ncbi:universal stress protein [Pseudoalteromonas sp. RB2-MNA-CIBAN-0110]|uniref:universal stress protein n=1 Tax=Pseudoalteromonas sp. RB2-MNA-CIBAN-0110 TaxID=3140439 RepID=UPI003318A98D
MKKIITCIDGSVITHAVTEAAIWASKKLDKSISFIHMLEKIQQTNVGNYTGTIGLGAQSDLLEEMTKLDEHRSKVSLKLADELLDSVAVQAKIAHIQNYELIKRHGDVIDAIIDFKDDTRLIVIGRNGVDHRVDLNALGSHIETLVRSASQPILLISRKFKQPNSFMIAYDGRETADKALQQVIDGGLLHGLHCHLVSINNNEKNLEEKFLNAQFKLSSMGFEVSASFLEGNIFDSLMQYKEQNNIDLIVMGAFGHSKLRQFFVGSNTIKMLENNDVPVIILK